MGFEGIPQRIVNEEENARFPSSSEQNEGLSEHIEDFLERVPPGERRAVVEAMVRELPPHEQETNRKALLQIVDVIDEVQEMKGDRQTIFHNMRQMSKEQLRELETFQSSEDMSPEEKRQKSEEWKARMNETQQKYAERLERRLEYLRNQKNNSHD